MPAAQFLWINKTAASTSLSHSHDKERIELLSQAQRTSRQQRKTMQRGSRQNTQLDHRTKTLSRRRMDGKGKISVGEQLSCCRDHGQVRTISTHPGWTSEEKRGIRYFYQMTTRKIVTVHQDAAFWRDLLPRVTDYFPPFRHLIVAIAATHEIITTGTVNTLDILAMQQCNKATHALSTSVDLSVPMLLVSSILISAWHLLRCDMVSADRMVENGLKLVHSQTQMSACDKNVDMIILPQILRRLGKCNGFKLWAADIAYRFDTTVITDQHIVFEMRDCVTGPFLDTADMAKTYRTLLLDVVVKIMRNLAGKAYIHPESLLAQECFRQFGLFSYYWDAFYRQIPDEDEKRRLDAKSIRLWLYNGYVLLHTKICASSESGYDKFTWVYQRMLMLAEELVAAHGAGQHVQYLDRAVNGTLCVVGLACREPLIRQQTIRLLQCQKEGNDELTNFLRGLLISMVQQVEETGLDIKSCQDVPLDRRIHLVAMHCREADKAIQLQFTKHDIDRRRGQFSHIWRKWDENFSQNYSALEIDACLQGIVATFFSYNKADIALYPQGYVREMIFQNQLTRVIVPIS